MSTLETEFERSVRSSVEECQTLGYSAHDFQAMLQTSSAVRVAEKLVASGNIQTGLKRLHGMGRADLAIESIMLEPRFQPLFQSQTLEAARWRLDHVTKA